jgi:FkbM family methyltransferase
MLNAQRYYGMNNEHQIPQALLRAWPFPRGAGGILDRYFSNLSFSRAMATVRTTDNFEIIVAPNELIGRHIYLTGEFDRSIVEVCNFSGLGDTFLDIGANIGYVSACFLNNVQNSNVVAVEPQPDVLEIIAENLNRFGRFEIYRFAIADGDGKVWFEIDPDNAGAGRIVEECGVRSMRVETRSADRMFSGLVIQKLNLVKIDAEGFEDVIVKSCTPQFVRLRPRAVLFEDQAANINRIREQFSKLDYCLYGIKISLRHLSLVNIEIAHPKSFRDYIAVSRSREIPDLARKMMQS